MQWAATTGVAQVLVFGILCVASGAEAFSLCASLLALRPELRCAAASSGCRTSTSQNRAAPSPLRCGSPSPRLCVVIGVGASCGQTLAADLISSPVSSRKGCTRTRMGPVGDGSEGCSQARVSTLQVRGDERSRGRSARTHDIFLQ